MERRTRVAAVCRRISASVTIAIGLAWLVGCSPSTNPSTNPSTSPSQDQSTNQSTGQTASKSTRTEKPSGQISIETANVALADAPLPPDLGTRDFGHDWPSFLGPDRSSTSRETDLLLDWPESGPPIVWQTPIGTSYSAPTIARGRLFHFDRFDSRNRLTCRNAETGSELWTYDYPTEYEDLLGYNNGPRCSPIIDGDRVYLVGPEGQIHCVRTIDGTLYWKIDTFREFHIVKNFFGVGSTPLVWHDLLIVNMGGSPPGGPNDVYAATGPIPSNGTGIVALDKFTGEVRYQTSDELASYSSPIGATIDGRPWCFLFARGGLIGFHPETGEADFHCPWRSKTLESVNAATPVVVGNEVLISECYGVGSSLLSVRPGGYDVVWADERRGRRQAMLAHWCTPIHVDGFFYGCSGYRGPNDLRCVDWRTGEVQWKQTGFKQSSILLADRHLIVINGDGTLRIVRPNPTKYDLAAESVLRRADGRALLKPPCWTAPVLSHGLLYVRGKERIVCLELREGE